MMGLPEGNAPVVCHDRAILKSYIYSGARLVINCHLQVSDFHRYERGATIRLIGKDHRRRCN